MVNLWELVEEYRCVIPYFCRRKCRNWVRRADSSCSECIVRRALLSIPYFAVLIADTLSCPWATGGRAIGPPTIYPPTIRPIRPSTLRDSRASGSAESRRQGAWRPSALEALRLEAERLEAERLEQEDIAEMWELNEGAEEIARNFPPPPPLSSDPLVPMYSPPPGLTINGREYNAMGELITVFGKSVEPATEAPVMQQVPAPASVTAPVLAQAARQLLGSTASGSSAWQHHRLQWPLPRHPPWSQHTRNSTRSKRRPGLSPAPAPALTLALAPPTARVPMEVVHVHPSCPTTDCNSPADPEPTLSSSARWVTNDTPRSSPASSVSSTVQRLPQQEHHPASGHPEPTIASPPAGYAHHYPPPHVPCPSGELIAQMDFTALLQLDQQLDQQLLYAQHLLQDPYELPVCPAAFGAGRVSRRICLLPGGSLSHTPSLLIRSDSSFDAPILIFCTSPHSQWPRVIITAWLGHWGNSFRLLGTLGI